MDVLAITVKKEGYDELATVIVLALVGHGASRHNLRARVRWVGRWHAQTRRPPASSACAGAGAPETLWAIGPVDCRYSGPRTSGADCRNRHDHRCSARQLGCGRRQGPGKHTKYRDWNSEQHSDGFPGALCLSTIGPRRLHRRV